jgi:heme-degrading monooxygenase HmoA
MAIKVIIQRSIKEPELYEVLSLLKVLRIEAMNRPGYISGETLVNHYDPRRIAVISSWQSVEDWVSWQESDERKTIETQLEKLLQAPAQCEVYDLGVLSKGKGFLI